MSEEKQQKTCKSCIHFKCGQRELNYWDGIGFCINSKFKFDTIKGRLVGVFDKGNVRDREKISGNPAHDIETVEHSPINLSESRYCLQVSEDFGCIYHERRSE